MRGVLQLYAVFISQSARHGNAITNAFCISDAPKPGFVKLRIIALEQPAANGIAELADGIGMVQLVDPFTTRHRKGRKIFLSGGIRECTRCIQMMIAESIPHSRFNADGLSRMRNGVQPLSVLP